MTSFGGLPRSSRRRATSKCKAVSILSNASVPPATGRALRRRGCGARTEPRREPTDQAPGPDRRVPDGRRDGAHGEKDMLGSLVVRASDLRLNGCEFDLLPPHYRSVGTGWVTVFEQVYHLGM